MTKLTLSINEDVVRKAEEVSRRKGKSLSELIEEYLTMLSAKETKEPSAVKKLSGVLKHKVPAGTSLKKAKGEYLKKKHGL